MTLWLNGQFGIFNVLKGSAYAYFVTFCVLCNSSWVMVQAYRKNQEPAVSKLKEPILDEITSALIGRHELNFTRQDTSSLWFLCKQVITNFNTGNFCSYQFEFVNNHLTEVLEIDNFLSFSLLNLSLF